METILKRTIEERLQNAFQKNPITRDRLVLKILKLSIEKCVHILLRHNKRYTRLNNADDLIQEARLTVLQVVQNQDLSLIKCAVRTYLLGAVKRRVWGIIREEYAVKRQAQTKAVSLTSLDILNIQHQIKLLNIPVDEIKDIETQNIIEDIENHLSNTAKEVFIDLMKGYTINEISYMHRLPLQTVYTILRRKIKPIARRRLKG